MKDYYQILQISPAAASRTIKIAYKKLASKYHPDKNNNSKEAEELFKLINEAYKVLSDDLQKQEYDNQRNLILSNVIHEAPSSATDQPHKNKKQSYKKFSSPLDSIIQLEISLEEAFFGCSKNISITINKNDTKEREEMTISIPKGVKHRQKFELKGKSHQKNGETGNLFVEVKIKKHPLFRVQRKNLILLLPLNISNAVAGVVKILPSLTGQVELAIPPITHSGSIFTLKEQGLFLDDSSSKRGDMIIQVIIDIPSEITEEEKKWFKNFSSSKMIPPAVAQFNIQSQKLLVKRAS